MIHATPQRIRVHAFITLFLWATLLLTGGCSTNPATGQMQLNILSESEEIHLGEESAPEFLAAYGGELPDAQVVAHVRTLGQQLAAVSERSQLPWEFEVVDSDVINAFALPGGKVFISRGLLASMTNEAQLAGVLGHEVGHVTAQHVGQQMTQAMGLQLGLAVAGITLQSTTDDELLATLGIVGGQVAGGVYLLKYGRDQEHQADELGLRYMSRLGYDPIGQVQVMQILKTASGGGTGIEMLSTHPLPDSRIKRLQALIQQQYPGSGGSAYGLGQERFENEVLDRLKRLPAAKHTASADPQALPIGWCTVCNHQHTGHGG